MRPSRRGDGIGTSVSWPWRQMGIPCARLPVVLELTEGPCVATSVWASISPVRSERVGHKPVMRMLSTSAHAGRKGNTIVPPFGRRSVRMATPAQLLPCANMSEPGGADHAIRVDADMAWTPPAHYRPHRFASRRDRRGGILLRPNEELTETERAYRHALCQACPPIALAHALADAFGRMVRARAAADLNDWLLVARRSRIPELVSFASGIVRDFDAVAAALTSPHSQGQVEGQVNRLKLLKRQSYGRANLDLLRRRLLYYFT